MDTFTGIEFNPQSSVTPLSVTPLQVKKLWVLFWVLTGSKSFEMIQNPCK
jgi:hypothetical protein